MMTTRLSLSLALFLCAFGGDDSAPAADEPQENVDPLPCSAEVVAQRANVRALPEAGAARIGLVEKGAVVEVASCEPDCSAPGGWAEVGGGWVKSDALRMDPTLNRIPAPASPLLYGNVRRAGLSVRDAPEEDARILERLSPPRTVAFFDDEVLLAQGWLRRVEGGFVAAADVSLVAPSLFQGEAFPPGPIAFTVEDTPLRGLLGEPLLAAAQSRFDVLALRDSKVLTSLGTLPRGSVRVATPRPRPEGVPEGARWVHIDTREQVLTAYEGDRWVYATLVSTGKSDKPTLRGLFRVWVKERRERMHGDDYYVEDVPDILYFHGSQGLHAAFWHDDFGRPRSHGCVNLAPEDARWIFQWAPPVLPADWHAIYPTPSDDALWVQVE